jgi:hypothetical protein
MKLGIKHKDISNPLSQGYRARTGRLGEIALSQALTEAGQQHHDLNATHGFNHPGADFKVESSTGTLPSKPYPNPFPLLIQ